MVLAAVAGEAVVKKIAEGFVDNLFVQLQTGSPASSGQGSLNLQKGAQLIGSKLAGILPGVLAEHAPEQRRAAAQSAANDLLDCLKKTQISYEEILQTNLDPEKLSSLIHGCIAEKNISPERKENLAKLSDEFSKQLIISLCESSEFRIAFMRRCLSEFARVSEALARIEQRLATQS